MGKKDYKSALKSIEIAFVLFQFFPQYIINIFGSESDLYNEYALLCFKIYLSGIIFTCVTKCCSIYLQSIGKPVKSMFISLSRDILIFIPCLVLLASMYGVVGMLWAALLVGYKFCLGSGCYVF